MVRDLGLRPDREVHNRDSVVDQHVIGEPALLGIMRRAGAVGRATCDELSWGHGLEYPQSLAVRLDIEITADDQRVITGRDGANEVKQPSGLETSLGGIVLTCLIAKPMHMGNGNRPVLLIIIDGQGVRIPRARVRSEVVG